MPGQLSQTLPGSHCSNAAMYTQLCTCEPWMIAWLGSVIGKAAACDMTSMSALCHRAAAADTDDALLAASMIGDRLGSLNSPKSLDVGGSTRPSYSGKKND